MQLENFGINSCFVTLPCKRNPNICIYSDAVYAIIMLGAQGNYKTRAHFSSISKTVINFDVRGRKNTNKRFMVFNIF